MLDDFLTQQQSDDFATSHRSWLEWYEKEMTEDELDKFLSDVEEENRQKHIQEKSRRT